MKISRSQQSANRIWFSCYLSASRSPSSSPVHRMLRLLCMSLEDEWGNSLKKLNDYMRSYVLDDLFAVFIPVADVVVGWDKHESRVINIDERSR